MSTLKLRPGSTRRSNRSTLRLKPKPQPNPNPEDIAKARSERQAKARAYLIANPIWAACLPLAIGIHKEIIADKPGDVSGVEVRKALAKRAKSRAYLQKITAGADRYGWAGDPAGKVTDQEAAYAAEQIEKREKKND